MSELHYARLISDTANRQLLRAFTNRGMEFFRLYFQIYAYTEGMDSSKPEEGFSEAFKFASRILFQHLASEDAKNGLQDLATRIRPLLHRLDTNNYSTSTTRMLIEAYNQAIMLAARDRDVYLTGKKVNAQGFLFIRMMSQKEEKLERLRKENPEMYDNIQQGRNVVHQIDKEIIRVIRDNSMTPSQTKIMDRIVNIGTDPKTNERFVFDSDGDILPVDEYITKRKEFLRSQRKMERVFPPDLSDIRKVSDEEIEALAEGEVEYYALTDDKAKQNQVTRIYPVRKVAGQSIIVDGRFKGFYLDDVVNSAGRMIEGVAYDYDPKLGRVTKLENTNEDGSVNVKVSREPYVTLDSNGNLFLKMPSVHAFSALRNTMADLSKLVPTIQYVKDSRKSSYIFEPKDFAAIRNALQGIALSNAAMEKIRAYFKTLAQHELATADENLAPYSLEKIGGFKPGRELFVKQKKALAWVESRGMSGVIALDTGIGKCVRGDTLIRTNKGLVPISTLNPGVTEADTVASITGWKVQVGSNWLPVKNFYMNGVAPTVKATTRIGLEIEGTHVHPILRRNADGTQTFVKLADIAIGDYVCVERTPFFFPEEEPPTVFDMCQSPYAIKYPTPERMNPDLARFTGYVVAEACTNSNSTISITQHKELNPETHADIRNTAKKLFGWERPNQHNGDISIIVCSTYLREWFEHLGIGRDLARTKTVPPIIFQSTRESVRQFLKAMIDSEGCVNSSNIEFSTASEEMGKQIQQLLLCFGIVSQRKPKRIAKYDHTYWRIYISGENARIYEQEIGFISARKIEALHNNNSKPCNPNHDIIPHTKDLLTDIYQQIKAVAGGVGNAGGLIKKYSTSLLSTFKLSKSGARNPTFRFLQEVQKVCADLNIDNQPIQDILDTQYLYDPVVALDFGQTEVMDIEVDDPCHSFVGNGIVNHNTISAIAIMQKLKRDGYLDDAANGNGRFLYVCPNALVGNLPKEMYGFLEDPDALLDQTDIMSYQTFAKNMKKNPNFADRYVAVFFDEAQALKNPNSAMAKSVLRMKHPRKIALTASPMERSPMEVFVLTAITNNIDLSTKEGKAILLAFRKRFCEEVGGRIIGMKSDPITARDLRIWVKQNLFFADKQDVEEIALPKLRKSTVAITMSPEVEVQYRSITDGIEKVLSGLVAKYRDRDLTATDPALENARFKLRKQFQMLTELALMPDLLVPGARNPKLDECVRIIDEKIESSARIILFTDVPRMASHTGLILSSRFPGKIHAVGLADTIDLWKNGKKVQSYGKKAYTAPDGQTFGIGSWKTYVLKYIVSNNPEVVSLTLTSTYAVGQNLQEFSSVIHLDRDSWNSETMTQRTARAWRTGQGKPVEEYTLDAVYSNPRASKDATLDQIRAAMQQLESELFDQVVIQSQSEALGKEFFSMKRMDASFYALNRKMMELQLSPYVARMGQES